MKYKVITVFGTRPEAVKMAPLVAELRRHSADLDVTVCVTGQHREMLDQVLRNFALVPDLDMNVMKRKQTLAQLSATILAQFETILRDVAPDVVIVHGDTTTALACSLAAFYAKVPVAHVEAGLRSGNKSSPWPEEVNRRLTSQLAEWHFAPTLRAQENLLRAGIAAEKIFVTGNTIVDALQFTQHRLKNDAALAETLAKQFAFLDPQKRLLLVTGHRRDNFGGGFEEICEALRAIANSRDDVQIVYPVHLNPNVREPVHRLLARPQLQDKVYLLEPLDYLPFVYLMQRAYFIITDSGGIQEEGSVLGKPLLVTLVSSERQEGLEAGTACLVGAERHGIIQKATTLLDDHAAYARMAWPQSFYGDGTAAQKITLKLVQLLKAKRSLSNLAVAS